MSENSLTIVSVVGARPEFIQAQPLRLAFQNADPPVREILVHTGQHYDYALSQAFFDELDLPAPEYHLGAGSASPSQQIAAILTGMEQVFLAERPDWVVVRGDTNSTLAAALATSKAGIPLAHVEAGERSFDRSMPEEINRLVADRLAQLHLCASRTALDNLAAEGLSGTVHWTGDVLLDALQAYLPVARQKSNILDQLRLAPGSYTLATVHRAKNTDRPARLAGLVAAFNRAGETVVFPQHPRVRQALAEHDLRLGSNVLALDPLGYFDMLVLAENARRIATDSGGLQREAYFLGVPCLTLREETEWIETVATGWNRLVGTDPGLICSAWFGFHPKLPRPPIFGDGRAAGRVARLIVARNADI